MMTNPKSNWTQWVLECSFGSLQEIGLISPGPWKVCMDSVRLKMKKLFKFTTPVPTVLKQLCKVLWHSEQQTCNSVERSGNVHCHSTVPVQFNVSCYQSEKIVKCVYKPLFALQYNTRLTVSINYFCFLFVHCGVSMFLLFYMYNLTIWNKRKLDINMTLEANNNNNNNKKPSYGFKRNNTK